MIINYLYDVFMNYRFSRKNCKKCKNKCYKYYYFFGGKYD